MVKEIKFTMTKGFAVNNLTGQNRGLSKYIMIQPYNEIVCIALSTAFTYIPIVRALFL